MVYATSSETKSWFHGSAYRQTLTGRKHHACSVFSTPNSFGKPVRGPHGGASCVKPEASPARKRSAPSSSSLVDRNDAARTPCSLHRPPLPLPVPCLSLRRLLFPYCLTRLRRRRVSKPEGCRVYSSSVWLELCDACRVSECIGCLIDEAMLLAGIVNSKQTEVLRASQPMPSGTTSRCLFSFVAIFVSVGARENICCVLQE